MTRVRFIPAQGTGPRRRHPLHGNDRIWTQTNCYVDLWVELLHLVGRDPVAGLGFTFSSDFDGTQWTFLKPPPEDLRALYGIEVAELNIWRPVRDHIAEQLGRRVLLTVEVDSFHLPDTAGDSYRATHGKTTIVPLAMDIGRRTLRYLHNAGTFSLSGDDFEAVLPPIGPGHGGYLAPYVERIVLDGLAPTDGLATRAAALAVEHLRRRPATNPVQRMGERLLADVTTATGGDIDAFHRLMFGTCRQCGSAAELAADHAEWLDTHLGVGSAAAAPHFRDVATGAKSLQFTMARAMHGRAVDVSGTFERMASSYDEGMRIVTASLGG
ncbi:MAG: hypothetical protein QOF57_769 [Frankiaceae bacterium]|nr:hypothetical protein [Frankiaceae bacterium]